MYIGKWLQIGEENVCDKYSLSPLSLLPTYCYKFYLSFCNASGSVTCVRL